MEEKFFESVFQTVDEFEASTIRELEEEYEDVQEELLFWLAMFSVDDKLDWLEMRRNLTAPQLRRLKRYLGDEVEDRVRVRRIDAINLILETRLEEINQMYSDKMEEFSIDLYKEVYYNELYELQQENGTFWVVPAVVISEILNKLLKPWTADGINFVERIEIRSSQLLDQIRREITQSILMGENPDNIVDTVRKRFKVSLSAAKNIINTESTRVVSEATRDAMRESEIKYYQLRAVLDARTSDICLGMNGKIFPLSEFEIGITASPFHSHCRTIEVPYSKPNKQGYTDKIKTYGEWFEKYIQK